MDKLFQMRPQVAALFLLTILGLASCKKPENDLGLDLQPESELLNVKVIDTVSFIMYSEVDDSLRADELSNNIVGSFYDPEFGYAEASTYFQLRMEGENVTFDEANVILDSVVLSLEYTDYYGELDAQTFGVYELIDTLFIDSAYYVKDFTNFDSTGSINPSPNLIEPGYETVTPDPLALTYVGNDTLDPQLRLRLRNAWGQKIIDADESTELATNEQFLDFIHGLYVRPENSMQSAEEGAMLYFNLEDAASKITLYYRDSINGDPKEFDLVINDKCARYTRSRHDYSGSNVGLMLADSTQGRFANYIQTLGGLRTKVHFPYIMDLADSGLIAINRAELVLPVEYYENSNFYPNQAMSSLMVNDEGETSFLPDYFYGTAPLAESYDIDEKEFRFGIGGFIQDVLQGDISDPTVIIETNQSSVSGNRCILSGPLTINRKKPKLILTYTKY